MTTSLYEAAVLNHWRLNGDQCNIKTLRNVYLEIYYQKCHYNWRPSHGRRSCSTLYKILRKYGRKVPFSNGSWKYDPEYADANTTPEQRESIYFSEFAKFILNELQTCINNYNKNYMFNHIKTKWKFSYDEPNSYHYYMSLNCYVSTTFMKIPFSVTLAKKSMGIDLFMTDKTEIVFFNEYNPSFYGLTQLMNQLQKTFTQDSICN